MVSSNQNVVVAASFGSHSSGSVVISKQELITMLRTMDAMKRKLQVLLKE